MLEVRIIIEGALAASTETVGIITTDPDLRRVEKWKSNPTAAIVARARFLNSLRC